MRAELVTTLKRRATELLAEVERDGEPILITRRGLPSAYLVDVETYEFQQRRMAILEGIARGERDAAAGRVLSHEEVEKRMAKWLK
ncbi:MAG: type II toxin-antitoxin system Phd/YefM family antitoxin [Pyrinomonadaceae bacterium]